MLIAAIPAGANAETWRHPRQKGVVVPADLSRVVAKGPIRDRVLHGPRAQASAVTPTRIEEYYDRSGNSIAIGSAIPDVDLRPFASLLMGTIHGREMNELRVLVVLPHEVGPECGGSAEAGIVACYYADDPRRLFSGQMILPSSHPDLRHAVVHEYGHHMDNQLLNLGHLGLCDFAQDGSRRWFFARDAYDDLLGQSGCNERVKYSRLLGELYAEDFVAYNGIHEWFTSAFPPPTRGMLDALHDDLEYRFRPRRKRYRGRLARGYYRPRSLSFDSPVFFTARLRGPRSTDFDLRLIKRGRRRPIEASTSRRSREQITTLLHPGSYRLDVIAYAGQGPYRLVVDIE